MLASPAAGATSVLASPASGATSAAPRASALPSGAARAAPSSAARPSGAAASGGGMSPDDVIAKHCTACHSIGLLEAPKIGDTAAWKARADKEGGLDGLLAKAITGLNAMPPKGTCGECSDAALKAAIQKMSGLYLPPVSYLAMF